MFKHGDQGGTYNGNPLMTAVGIAVFDALAAPGFLPQRASRAASNCRRACWPWRPSGACRASAAMGLLRALILDRDDGPAHRRSRRACWSRKGCCSTRRAANLLRFMPALNVTEAEIAQMLEWLDAVIAKVRK